MTNADIHNCHLLTIHIYELVAVGITMLILCAMPSQQHQTEYSIFTTRQTIDAQSIQNTFFMMRIPGDTHILCIQLMQHNSQQLLVTSVQHVVWTAQRRILYQKYWQTAWLCAVCSALSQNEHEHWRQKWNWNSSHFG